MSVRVVSSLAAPKDKLKSQSIDEPIFFEPNHNFIPMFLTFNTFHSLKLIAKSFSMCPSNQYFQLAKLENFIE